MPKITSLTGVFHLKLDYEGEQAEASLERAEILARILDKASGLDPGLRELVVDFVDYIANKEVGAES